MRSLFNKCHQFFLISKVCIIHFIWWVKREKIKMTVDKCFAVLLNLCLIGGHSSMTSVLNRSFNPTVHCKNVWSISWTASFHLISCPKADTNCITVILRVVYLVHWFVVHHKNNKVRMQAILHIKNMLCVLCKLYGVYVTSYYIILRRDVTFQWIFRHEWVHRKNYQCGKEYFYNLPWKIYCKLLLYMFAFVKIHLVWTGAHEPPKEHATECHHNPNYVITFELNWLLSRIYGFK